MSSGWRGMSDEGEMRGGGGRRGKGVTAKTKTNFNLKLFPIHLLL